MSLRERLGGVGRAARRSPTVRRGWRFVRHLARKELLLLIMPVVLVVGIWGFAAVTDEVLEGEAIRFDDWAILALRDPHDPARPIGPAWLGNIARDITSLGSGAVLTIFTLIVAGALVIYRSWHEVLLLLAALLGGAALSLGLKDVFERERPTLVPHLDVVSTYSFPSGHALLSAVVYLTIGAILARLFSKRRVKLYLLGVATSLALLVGVSRVYVGVHYPSDVLAGWCAGAAWAALCWLVTIFLQWRGDVARDADTARAAAVTETPAAASGSP